MTSHSAAIASSRYITLIWPVLIVAVIVGQFWYPDIPPGTSHDSYSVTAEGQRALHEMLVLSPNCYAVSRNSYALDQIQNWLASDEMLCILGPERSPTPSEWRALSDWVRAGGRLVYAFRGSEPLEVPGLGVKYQPFSSPGDDTLLPETSLVASREIAWWTDGALETTVDDILVEYNGTPQAARLRLGNGAIVFVASSLPFSNQLQTFGDNSLLAWRLLEAVGPLDWVTIDESLNASGTPRAVGLLLDPLVRPLTLQLLVAALLYAWWNSRRFGPYDDRLLVRRQNLIEHTDAIGAWYWRGRNSIEVLRAFVAATPLPTRRKDGSPLHPEQALMRHAEDVSGSDPKLADALRRVASDLNVAKLSRRIIAAHLKTVIQLRQRLPARIP
ncbi:MAG: DUF4350 domain-containing protein [Planctomycetaceae bacterium]|nr:DUF4350 domain-containing protein [Planctomycetaceae bacterium]